MPQRLGKLIWSLTLMLGTHLSWSQVQEYPISRTVTSTPFFQNATHDTDTLTLPFWDDFSKSSLRPDSSLWLYGENVNVNPGRGLLPPSLNVATFDGTDVHGVPYSLQDERGLADSLVSQPINLGNITSGLQNTLYLSFFWQKRGNGDIPEKEDSIRLQFKDINGVWITQWSAVGGDTTQTTSFKEELVQVPPGAFQHSGFQFRFQSYGKLTGGYDNWHLDYVLLRTRRNDQDLYVRDRTLSTYPTSIFRNFTAIPFEHYCVQAGQFRDSTSIQGFSLEPPVGFPASIRFSAQIFNANTGVLIDEMNNTNEDGLIFNGQQFITLQANAIDTSALIAAKTDQGLEILTKFFIRTKDSLMFDFVDPGTGDSIFFDNINLSVNDTATARISLGKYYAYDDGTAEIGAGVNTINGKLAYLYQIPVQDTLTAVDIYFPNTESNQANESVRLSVWRRLVDSEQLLHSQLIFIQASDTLDEFFHFPLSKPLLVSDSVFIGIQQTGMVPIVIGLDKNSDSGDMIFFNTSGVWEANTGVRGSLMLRPVFGSTEDVITGLPDPPLHQRLAIYPNPLTGSRVSIMGTPDLLGINIFDMQGREVHFKFDKYLKVIEFSHQPGGIYILQLHTSKFTQIEKLILLER